jgi:hypothetical protein
LQTLIPSSTSTSTSSVAASTVAATTPAAQQGPVGQPAPTGVQGPTVYTYTTTDANGVTIAVVDTFTPSFATGPQTRTLMSGTILGYSSWLGIIGTNTAASQAQASGARISWLSGGWCGVFVATVSSIFSGVWLILV